MPISRLFNLHEIEQNRKFIVTSHMNHKPFSNFCQLVFNIFSSLKMDWNLPCKPGAAGSIPGFSSLLDETKPLPLHNMTLAVGRMLNTHTHGK